MTRDKRKLIRCKFLGHSAYQNEAYIFTRNEMPFEHRRKYDILFQSVLNSACVINIYFISCSDFVDQNVSLPEEHIFLCSSRAPT